MEEERAKEYSSYQQVYQQKGQEKKERIQQLKLLREYSGCKECGSKEVDAYDLYEGKGLVCQPCLAQKTAGSSSPVSFLEEQKWYKRHWKIDLVEWLENYGCLPVNANCAREWLKDKGHLEQCDCLGQESQKLYLLFSNSLRESKEKLKDCQCEESEKVRVDYLDSAGSGWIYCEKCEAKIESAGHHGVIKNRNDPKFWGLNVKEKVLCGDCLEKRKGEMPAVRRAEFNRYRKVRRL
jgi:hypothetical protein